MTHQPNLRLHLTSYVTFSHLRSKEPLGYISHVIHYPIAKCTPVYIWMRHGKVVHIKQAQYFNPSPKPFIWL